MKGTRQRKLPPYIYEGANNTYRVIINHKYIKSSKYLEKAVQIRDTYLATHRYEGRDYSNQPGRPKHVR